VINHEQTIALRAVKNLGPQGGIPSRPVVVLERLAELGLIDVMEEIGERQNRRVRVVINAEGQSELTRQRDEEVRVSEALASRCHDRGGAGGQLTAAGLVAFARLIADDEDARILWDLWVARERASTEA
jgi:DNA-binding PadR family transcriptional regulator